MVWLLRERRLDLEQNAIGVRAQEDEHLGSQKRDPSSCREVSASESPYLASPSERLGRGTAPQPEGEGQTMPLRLDPHLKTKTTDLVALQTKESPSGLGGG